MMSLVGRYFRQLRRYASACNSLARLGEKKIDDRSVKGLWGAL
jgi:hypothetical protein